MNTRAPLQHKEFYYLKEGEICVRSALCSVRRPEIGESKPAATQKSYGVGSLVGNVIEFYIARIAVLPIGKA